MLTTLLGSPLFDGFLGGVIASIICFLLAVLVHWLFRRFRYVSDGFIRSWLRTNYPFFHIPKSASFYRITEAEFYRLVKLAKGNPEWLYHRLAYPPLKTLEAVFPRQRFDGFRV